MPSLIQSDTMGKTDQTTQPAMQITINGQDEALQREMSVADLLAFRGIEPRRVAVEVNEDLVPRATFPDMIVRNGDKIEIVAFVGGG